MWNVKQDPAKYSELSLASSQNVAEPQSITWFWVKNHTEPPFFFHGFGLKMGFHAKLALVSEAFFGRVQAPLLLAWTLHHQLPQTVFVDMSPSRSALWRSRFWATLLMCPFRWLKIIRHINKKYYQLVYLFALSFYKNRRKFLKSNESGAPLWCKESSIWWCGYCHCSGLGCCCSEGLIPGPGTPTLPWAVV